MLSIPAQTITGKVVDTKHVGTSSVGNPTFDVTIRLETIDGTPVQGEQVVTIRTQVNSGIAYGIGNSFYRDETHEYTLTKAGRLKSVRKVA